MAPPWCPQAKLAAEIKDVQRGCAHKQRLLSQMRAEAANQTAPSLRIASGSVTPPWKRGQSWTDIVTNADAKKKRLLAPPAPPATPAPRAMAKPVGLLGEQYIDMDLAAITSTEQVMGPDTPTLFGKLRSLPDEKKFQNMVAHMESSDLDSKIANVTAAFAESKADIEATKMLSPFLVNATKLRKDSLEKELITLQAKAADQVATKTMTHSALDKLRAAAVDARANWVDKVNQDKIRMSEEVKHAQAAINHAIEALRSQSESLSTALEAHSDVWATANNVVDASHMRKINALTERVAATAQAETALPAVMQVDAGTLPLMQPTHVTQLKVELSQARDEMAEQARQFKELIAKSEARYQMILASLPKAGSEPTMTPESASASTNSSSDTVPGMTDVEIIPCMTSEEKQARLAHASSVADKGKGKGAAQDGVAY